MRDSGNSDIQKPLRNLVMLDFKVQVFFQCCYVLLFTFYSYLQQGILSQVQKDVFSLVSSHFINCSSEYLPALVICSQRCLLPTCVRGDFEDSWQQKADCRLHSGHNIAPISIALPPSLSFRPNCCVRMNQRPVSLVPYGASLLAVLLSFIALCL